MLIAKFNCDDINIIEKTGRYKINEDIILRLEDVEIKTADIPGWIVTSDDDVTVALDIDLTQSLKEEGLAREFVNRIQNLRKHYSYNVTDKINIQIGKQ